MHFRKFIAAAALALAATFSVAPTPALAGAMSDFWENKVIDLAFRSQAYAFPATKYVALYTTACSDASGGTEVSGGSYARVAVSDGLTSWAGTQAAGSTSASSGTSGTTSNNAAITFPAPSANWGTVSHFSIMDASSGGNLLICAALTQAKTVNSGDAAPSFAASALSLQIDNNLAFAPWLWLILALWVFYFRFANGRWPGRNYLSRS